MLKQTKLAAFFLEETTDLSSEDESGSESSDVRVNIQDSDTDTNVVPAGLIKLSWPSCWDRKMWNNKKRDYPWLVSNEKNLGCSICIEVSSLGCYADKSIHIAKEWKSISVTPTGTNKEKQLMSLRNKLNGTKNQLVMCRQRESSNMPVRK